MRMGRGICAAFGVIALAPQAAVAGGRPIVVDVAANWVHEQSKIGMPAQLNGLARSSIEDSTASQSDIVGTYRDSARKTLVSVYVFRAGLVDVSVWQDRISRVIPGMAATYGNPDIAGRRDTLFTPTSGGTDSASRFVIPVSGKDVTATGSAVVAVDDWLVAVRMTSQGLSPSELDAHLAAFMMQLPLPKAHHIPPPAYQITDCGQSLPTKSARRAELGIADALIMGALQISLNEGEDKEQKFDAESPSGRFCRLGSGGNGYDVYRVAGHDDDYLVAFGDAGVVADVAPDGAAALLQKQRSFSLTLRTSEQSQFFRGFRTLPPVSQVLEVLSKEGPIGGAGRTPENAKTITVTTPRK